MPPKKNHKLSCYQCGQPAETAVSQSDKNPGKPYLKCTQCPSSSGQGTLFLGWFGEYDGNPPARKKFPPPQKVKAWQKKKKHESEEEEEEEEEESPSKKRKREEEFPFLDKLMRDKILKNAENTEDIFNELKILNENITKFVELLEKGMDKKE